MRTLKISFWVLIIYVITIFFNQGEKVYTSSIQYQNPIDYRVAKLEAFFNRFDSPFKGMEDHFINVADINGLDYRLLPVVSCVESSCGKHYRLNAFGWGSDTIDFGNDAMDSRVIAAKIATLKAYQVYRENRDLRTFARSYNPQFAEDYYRKLKYFYERIR